MGPPHERGRQNSCGVVFRNQLRNFRGWATSASDGRRAPAGAREAEGKAGRGQTQDTEFFSSTTTRPPVGPTQPYTRPAHTSRGPLPRPRCCGTWSPPRALSARERRGRGFFASRRGCLERRPATRARTRSHAKGLGSCRATRRPLIGQVAAPGPNLSTPKKLEFRDPSAARKVGGNFAEM